MSDKLTPSEQALQVCKSFVSLAWLDGTINFIFRFVAKTSELLLAIGIIISAADFLTDGRLMHNNLVLAIAWAWMQAIAIESSSGVVLMYALQAFKDKDKVKGGLYVALASMLALVGGVMLLTQIIYNTTGINMVTQGALAFVVAMAIARAIVSIAYIVMCRIKHIRFSGLLAEEETTPPSALPTIAYLTEKIDQSVSLAVTTALQQLEDLQQRRFEVVVQEITHTVVKEVTESRLLAMPKQPTTVDALVAKTATPAMQPDRLAIVKNALVATPSIKDKELATLAMCCVNTARKWKSKALAELEQ
jgi:hypothetical protein